MSKFLAKLARKLLQDETQQAVFIDIVSLGKAHDSAIMWLQPRPTILPFEPQRPHSWQPEFLDRVPSSFRAGRHPLHDNGDYYCLDSASALMMAPVFKLPIKPEIIFDVCAAPGGKSLMSSRLHNPATLICNEVVRSRCGALISNLKRCKIPSYVLSQDPEVLASHFADTADLVLVDAPCSGQSLLAKGETAPGCFHPVNVNKCMNRQRRIISQASQLVAPGGFLLYTTCTYSIEENELLCEWFKLKFQDFQDIEIPDLAGNKSSLTQLHAYRFWPSEGTGAGGFSCLFKRKDEAARNSLEIPDNFVRWRFPNPQADEKAPT